MSRPAWQNAADAWFKIFGAVILGYVILAHVIGLLKEFADVSIIAVGGVFLAYFVYPIVAWLNRRLPLWAALSIVYFGGAGLILLGLVFLVPTAVAQLQSLVHQAPTIQRSVEHFINNPSNPFLRRLPAPVQTWIHHLPAAVTRELQASAAVYTAKAISALMIALAVGTVAVAIPVVSIYMLAESAMIKRFFVSAFPERWRGEVIAFLGDVDSVIGGFIRGQIIVAVVVGVLAIIALVILHVPYAIVIGAWAGIADIIPYIGPFAGAIPAAIVAIIFNGVGSLLGVVVAFVIINQLEAHLLGPRIVSRTVKITPLGVIFALLIGAQLFGFIGLLVAVPLAGLVRVVLVHLFERHEVTNAELQPGLTHPPKDDLDPLATES